MKFCKDCEHFEQSVIWPDCQRFPLGDPDPIYGKQTRHSRRAEDERKPRGLIFNRDRCGPDGRYWQEKSDNSETKEQ